QPRRLGTLHRSGDDVLDGGLYPQTLSQFGTWCLCTRHLVRFVLRPREIRHESNGQRDCEPQVLIAHCSPPRPIVRISPDSPADAGASRPSPARNPWSCSAARHASLRLLRYSVDISKNVRCATSTCGYAAAISR